MQLLLVPLALPGLLLLARLHRQSVLRCGCAVLTAGAALGRLLDRLGAPNPVARAADSAGSHASGLFLVLVGTAVLSALWIGILHRRGRRVVGECPEPASSETPVVTAQGVNQGPWHAG